MKILCKLSLQKEARQNKQKRFGKCGADWKIWKRKAAGVLGYFPSRQAILFSGGLMKRGPDFYGKGRNAMKSQTSSIAKGLAAGLAVGAAAAVLGSRGLKSSKHSAKKKVNAAMKSVGNMIDSVSGMMH